MANTLRRQFMRNWFAIEAIPIYVIISGVIVGGGWYMGRLALGPTIVWTKSNPEPWNTIKPNQTTKMVNVNDGLAKSWSRDKL